MRIDFYLYGWLGESLAGDNYHGSRGINVPEGTTAWHFLTQFAEQNSVLIGDDVYDRQSKRFRGNVIVLLNGKHLGPGDKAELHEGDTVSLLKVFSGG